MFFRMRMKKHMNDNQIRDYDAVLDVEFGAPGTPERIAAEEQARAFYSGQNLQDLKIEEGV